MNFIKKLKSHQILRKELGSVGQKISDFWGSRNKTIGDVANKIMGGNVDLDYANFNNPNANKIVLVKTKSYNKDKSYLN